MHKPQDEIFKFGRLGPIQTVSIDRFQVAYIDDDLVPINMRPDVNPARSYDDTYMPLQILQPTSPNIILS